MTTRTPTAAQNMKPENVDSLQDLVRALNDSCQYLIEAADSIKDDEMVANTLRTISSERQKICDNIAGFITLTDEKPVEDGTFLGTLRTIWTAYRAGLNDGDTTVVLIEAERAEDLIVNKFKQVLSEVPGNPINDKLSQYFATIKHGHDRVLNLRNAYQNA